MAPKFSLLAWESAFLMRLLRKAGDTRSLHNREPAELPQR